MKPEPRERSAHRFSTLRFLVESYYDQQSLRVIAENRLRSYQKAEEPDRRNELQALSDFVDQRMSKTEAELKAMVLKEVKKIPIGADYLLSIPGVGPCIAGGLIAYIETPARFATISKLWSYSGFHTVNGLAPRRKKGETSNWNPHLKRICCLPGTTITTRSGPKIIEDIRVGDEVLTHKGRWRPVTEIMMNDHDGSVVQLRAHGLAGGGPLLTGNHPVLAKQMRVCSWQDGERARFRVNPRKVRVTQLTDSVYAQISTRIAAGDKGREIAGDVGCSESLVSKIKHGYTRQPTEDIMDWVRADAIQPGWRILCPTPPIGNDRLQIVLEDLPYLKNPAIRRNIELTHDVARLIGLYLGDGCTSTNRVLWFFGLHESDLSRFVINTLRTTFGLHAIERRVGNMRKVDCGSQQLQRWLDAHIGKRAHDKRIPAGWMSADELVITGLLRGLFESDGHLGDRVYYVSVNWHLAHSVTIMLRMLRIPATAVRCITNGFRGGICKSYRVQPCDVTGFYLRVFGQHRRPIPVRGVAEWDPEGSWHTARESLGQIYNGPVYNLEVEEDHSYTADGVAVHNCWLAGESFVKVVKSPYRPIYDKSKAFYRGKYPEPVDSGKKSREGKPILNYTDGHIHAMAKRRMVKIFLANLWMEWRRMEGLPVEPPYIIGRGGHQHLIEVVA